MKKFFAVLLSVILAVSFCVPAFAADEEASTLPSGLSEILNIIGQGGSFEDLTPEQAEQLKTYLDDTLFKKDENGEAVTDADGSYVPTMAASLLAQVITSTVDYSDAFAAIDEMKAAGVLSDAAYAQLASEIEELSNVDASIDQSRADAAESTTNPIDGVKDFFGNIFNAISGLLGGLFGGGDSDTPTTTKSTTNASGDDTFSNTQTGDVALFSVAGVALVAGLALVVTKKKEK